MGIGSYKEAERYRMRANKNLTRSFYLDTRRTLDDEPFAWEQSQDAGIMQPEAVQEFSDGGRVGFELGGKVRSRGEKIMSKDKLDLIDNIVSESNLNPFSSLSKNKVLEKAGYSHSAYSFVNSQVKEKLKTLIPIEEKFKNYVYNMMDNSNNILFDDLVKDNGIKNHLEKKFNLTVTNPTSPKIKNVYNIPEIKEFIKQGSHYETLNSYKNKEMTLSEVFNNIGSKKSYGIPR